MEREEQDLFVTVKVITDETFSHHEGFDLASFDKKNPPPSDLSSFRVLKQETYSTFKSRIARRFNYDENQIRLWVLIVRENKTVRPETPHLPDLDSALRMEDLLDNFGYSEYLRFYLDVIPDIAKPLQESMMVFLKHFNTLRQSLVGAGKIFAFPSNKVCDLTPLINERMQWAPGTPLKLYEEIRPGWIESMNPQWSLDQSEIQHGDIICFQVDLPEREIDNFEMQGLCSNPIQFYNCLQNCVMVTSPFRIYELCRPDNPTRCQFVSLLCTAALSDGGSEAAEALICGCLKLCRDSKALLSHALQTQFLNGRTLLHSAICSIDTTTPREDVPPIINALLDQCLLPLSEVVMGDIEKACCERNDNALLHTLRRHPALRPWTPDGSGYPNITVGEDYAITFTIPRFLNRMLVSLEVEIPFVLMGFLYRVTISCNPDRWSLAVSLDEERSRPKSSSGTLGRMSLLIQTRVLGDTPASLVPIVEDKAYADYIRGINVDFLRTR